MKKENASPDFVKMEHAMLDFWKENKCFDKLVEKNKNGKRFRFLDGPITANNRAGIHHFWGRTLKDIVLKYHALKGESQQFQNGFDAQGLWVEVNVEKELGLNGKPEILQYGLDKFTNKCMERVNYFGNEITNQSIRMGQWMDWDHSYYTNTDENILGIWHFLKKCSENGWIVKKNRPMVWCPRCGTSLSDHEMSNSYSEVEHTAIYLKLPITGKDYKMVAWTTTPWTLTANVALAVNPEMEYSLVKVISTGEKLVMGANAVKRVLKGDAEVVESFKGSELVGLTYETCFPELSEQQFEHRVVAWEDVAELEGSGVVHIAPGCGAEDFELGLKEDLKQICPIDEQGVLLPNTGFVAGKKTTDVVDDVVNRLKADNKLLYSHKHKHSYAHCWRCKTDIVYKLVSAWYIKMDEIRPLALKAIEEVNFSPAYAKKRMVDWLNNMGDWNISRSRFYGLPLPFYVCEKCGKVHVVGSLDELREKAVNPEEIDKLPHLHRPWIDAIKVKCECGAVAERIPEVGDVWLDAGITPFSTKKYFTDKEYFNNNFPSDYVCEMIEQIKLWFYSLLIMSVVLTGKAPYKNLLTYQYVMYENGGEFHKSGGNSLEADKFADRVGADAVRYLYGSSNPTNDMRFGESLTDEARRKMIGFWNIYTFFNTYACIDNPDIANYKMNESNLQETDKWLLQSVNDFVKKSDKNYSEYNNFLVVKDFEKLVDDISNFYIRVNRKRFWKSEEKEDQMTAYWCLYYAIKKLIQVMSPVIPFLTEYIWQNCVREVEKNEAESIMLAGFATPIECSDFSAVCESVEISRQIITLAQRLRNENQIKIKQPLRTMYVVGNEQTKKATQTLNDIITSELNIKQVLFETDNSKFNDEFLGVDFKKAGAILKGEVQKLKTTLAELNAVSMAKAVNEYKTGSVNVGDFNGLVSDIFVLQSKPKSEFVIIADNGITVVLDTTIDEDLMLEGLFREVVRSAQMLRKEANFRIEQRILIDITSSSTDINKMLEKFKDKLMEDVLAKSFGEVATPDIEKTIEIGGDEVNFKLKALD